MAAPQGPRRRHCRVLCRGLALLTLAGGALSLLGGVAAAEAPPPWTALAPPWADPVAVNDVCAAAPALVAAVGDGGRVGVSDSGGLAWTARSLASQGITADLFGVAFRDTAHGVVVGARGTVLVTSNGGATWRNTGFSGLPPTADLYDVTLAGLQGVAVGDDGTVLESSDGGESWRAVARPTTADLRCVDLASDGTAVIGAADGTVVLRHEGSFATTVAPTAITSVAAAATPAWGDGRPDVVVSTGWEVLGSDDGASLAPLLSTPYAGEPPWSALTYGGVPAAELLVAGATGDASYYSLVTSSWMAGRSGLDDARAAATPRGQSVAYVLASDGQVARTLSAGRPTATIAASTQTSTAGRRVTFTSIVRIAAPGRLVLEHRVVGGVWKAAEQASWTPSDWERQATLGYRPTLNNDFRLSFAYGTGSAVVSTTRRVTVSPRLTPDKLRVSVPRGTPYRFKGTVYPALRGERVRLYTDRGGRWHQIELGGLVRLQDGKRWISRSFGTPVRETYHLRARIDATSRHAKARSAVVTVVVR